VGAVAAAPPLLAVLDTVAKLTCSAACTLFFSFEKHYLFGVTNGRNIALLENTPKIHPKSTNMKMNGSSSYQYLL